MKKFFNNIYVFIALIFNLKIDIDPDKEYKLFLKESEAAGRKSK